MTGEQNTQNNLFNRLRLAVIGGYSFVTIECQLSTEEADKTGGRYTIKLYQPDLS